MAEKQKEFNDLPIEMFVEVFKYFNIHQVAFRYTEICIHWRENIALHILAPEIIRQAEANPSFKKLLEKNQWTEECEDVEMLIYIYKKMATITSKFIFWPCPAVITLMILLDRFQGHHFWWLWL